MSNADKVAPLPYSVDEDGWLCDGHDWPIADFDAGHATEQYVVTACNSHHALLAACEDLASLYANGYPLQDIAVRRALTEAAKAIAAAKGEETKP